MSIEDNIKCFFQKLIIFKPLRIHSTVSYSSSERLCITRICLLIFRGFLTGGFRREFFFFAKSTFIIRSHYIIQVGYSPQRTKTRAINRLVVVLVSNDLQVTHVLSDILRLRSIRSDPCLDVVLTAVLFVNPCLETCCLLIDRARVVLVSMKVIEVIL